MKKISTKTIFAAALTTVMTLNCGIAYAETIVDDPTLAFDQVNTNEDLEQTENVGDVSNNVSDETIPLDRICYAQVDMSCFTNLALDYVDKYVTTDKQGNFYISDSEALKNSLTPEQYSLVEEQITLTNTNNDLSLYADVGTESNPHNLTPGNYSVITRRNASVYWFTCTTSGATDFDLRSSYVSYFTIYKRTLLGKSEINKSGEIKWHTTTISSCEINNNSNTYLISVDSSFAGNIGATVSQHRDAIAPEEGKNAIWRPFNKSAMANTNILYWRYWYVPKESIPILYEYLLNDNVLDYQQQLLNGTITATGLATLLFPNAVGAATSVITSCVGMYIPNSKMDLLKKISQTAKFDGTQYTNGILMYNYMFVPQALTFYDVEAWDGGTMYGADGWTGSWEFN